MYYSVYYIKNCPITPKNSPPPPKKKEIALKHNESAIIVTCEITINNLTCDIIIFFSGRKFYKILFFNIIFFSLHAYYSHTAVTTREIRFEHQAHSLISPRTYMKYCKPAKLLTWLVFSCFKTRSRVVTFVLGAIDKMFEVRLTDKYT